jgi:hypothetical protein
MATATVTARPPRSPDAALVRARRALPGNGGRDPVPRKTLWVPRRSYRARFPAYRQGAVTPLAIPNGAKRLRFFSNRPAQVKVDLIGVSEPTSTLTLGYEHGAQGVATGGALAAVAHRVDAVDNEVSYVVTG